MVLGRQGGCVKETGAMFPSAPWPGRQLLPALALSAVSLNAWAVCPCRCCVLVGDDTGGVM